MHAFECTLLVGQAQGLPGESPAPLSSQGACQSFRINAAHRPGLQASRVISYQQPPSRSTLHHFSGLRSAGAWNPNALSMSIILQWRMQAPGNPPRRMLREDLNWAVTFCLFSVFSLLCFFFLSFYPPPPPHSSWILLQCWQMTCAWIANTWVEENFQILNTF